MGSIRSSWRVTAAVAALAWLPAAVSAQYVPPVPPPTCVSGCENAPGSGQSPPSTRTCRDVTVEYNCGTEQKCDDLKGAGIVCVEVAKVCTRTETICTD